MNGHFSAVGETPAAGEYEHGVQVVDEEKEFKYVYNTSTVNVTVAANVGLSPLVPT